ncbi:hypothetical protein CPTAbTP3Phi1_002 [Acinetobacter phage AbTP3phi1]|uniref:Uncharacterized protein n=1 Tax=Acinetobacter phage AbTP3phi1 TaxID=2920932 RepID=A0AC61TT97_9CAUD|nr:hypothetical protein CPTAbTP3Phi1_002 [Acinetobacter phage AbTP3phi1]
MNTNTPSTDLYIEITRVQRGLMDCLFHNEHLHSNGATCVACDNAKVYLQELKDKRAKLRVSA